MRRPDEKLKLWTLYEGMRDAAAGLKETADAFDAWDVRIGVTGKARRLKAANARVRKLKKGAPKADVQAARSACAEAKEAFSSAAEGPDLWSSGLLTAAGELVRDLGYREGDPSESMLAFGLVDRFVWVKAAAGGWPGSGHPDAPDFAPWIGERFQFVISEQWPVSFVRAVLRPGRSTPRPYGALPDFVARVRARIKAVERAAKRPGRPASAYSAALRRDGRRLFLEMTGRESADTLALADHDELGAGHDAEQPWPCDNCKRAVHRQLTSARKMLAGEASFDA